MALRERADPLLRSVDRIVFRSETVRVGAFRCPRGHPLFRDSGPIENDTFVFPRTRVEIAHAGGRRFAADPTVVTLYNRGQAYDRRAVDEAGDRCDYFAVDRALALELARARDPGIEDRPFRFDHGPGPAAAYLRQRALFQRLSAGAPTDPLEVEETVLGLLATVLDAAYAARDRCPAGDDAEAFDIARRARLVLSERYAEALSLQALGRAVGVSRARLCRAFRRATGTTLHACREQLRLRAALAALAVPGADLTQLALDLGYSSHSHFGASFRRAFGVPPSLARGRLAASLRPRVQ